MTGIISLLVASATLVAITGAVDYCKIESCNGRAHTMCLYPSKIPGPACGRMESNKLTADQKKEILDAHNEFRAIVASGQELRGNPGPQPAGIIPDLEWNDDLEVIAQRLANQCNFQHDACRNTDNYQVGQNLWMSYDYNSYSSTLKSAVKSWYDEVEDFNRHDVKSYKFSMSTGHYSQLVWGETTQIGCGIAKFRTGWYTTLLVCNYGPTGNFQGYPVYQTL